MKDSLVYCRLHFETLVQGPDYHPQLNFAELAAKGGGLTLPYFNGTGTAQKGRPRKRKSPAMGIDIPSYNTGETAELLGASFHIEKQQRRRRRRAHNKNPLFSFGVESLTSAWSFSAWMFPAEEDSETRKNMPSYNVVITHKPMKLNIKQILANINETPV